MAVYLHLNVFLLIWLVTDALNWMLVWVIFVYKRGPWTARLCECAHCQNRKLTGDTGNCCSDFATITWHSPHHDFLAFAKSNILYHIQLSRMYVSAMSSVKICKAHTAYVRRLCISFVKIYEVSYSFESISATWFIGISPCNVIPLSIPWAPKRIRNKQWEFVGQR